MITYLAKETPNNRTMYYVNGKLVSPKLVPDAIKLRIEPDVTLTVDGVWEDVKNKEEHDLIPELEDMPQSPVTREKDCPNVIIDTRKCIFNPDEKAEHIKFVNMQNVGLCHEHYTTMRTGQVVAQLVKVTL